MGTTITLEHAADVADRLCRLTGEAAAQARTAHEQLEELVSMLREIGTELVELRHDCQFPEYPYVLDDVVPRLTRLADDVERLIDTDGCPRIVIEEVGEYLEMLQLGASRLRRVAEEVQ